MTTFPTRSAALVATLLIGATARAGVITDFTEDFATDNSSWTAADGFSPVDWVAGGGAGGAADPYVSTTFAFADAGPFGASIFRAQDAMGASGGALFGDWNTDGVQSFSFRFRHNAPTAVPVFARFAGPANFPAAVGVSFAPVLPNTWTDITIPIAPTSPNLILEGAPYDDVFTDIGRVQVGFEVPAGFETDTTAYTFDLDAVSVQVPAPGAIAMLGLAGLAGGRRRRR